MFEECLEGRMVRGGLRVINVDGFDFAHLAAPLKEGFLPPFATGKRFFGSRSFWPSLLDRLWPLKFLGGVTLLATGRSLALSLDPLSF
jgi:hypothetical protein